MPRTLQKVHKHISKKRGVVEALHENSRDAQRLRRAGARDERLSRHAATTLKARQPYVDRIEYFHNAVQTVSEPLSDSGLAEIIVKYAITTPDARSFTHMRSRYINRDADEIEQLQKERRKGRPPSRREEALKQRTQTEDKEFNTGFWMPDLGDQDVLTALKIWNGEWSGLSTLKFIRLRKDAGKQTSTFPPKGMS
ncbi:translation machinery-associated protein 16 [Penicillium alfredii]|uniref:Translation machinery-associated protein 16 n=1 Tax=Penicillium alfredii TaxID=1506179 RepID=A0A9W9GAA3_9EURO|nr:translation machinery-associated protein 16 [Penicillium alfredii]KAJ5115044.1 translation machinery-associated protein 16 [Penicillium alfredii]